MESRESWRHPGKGEEMNLWDVEERKWIGRSGGWGKRKIPGRDWKYKIGNNQDSKRIIQLGLSIRWEAGKSLKVPEVWHNQGKSHGHGDIPDADKSKLFHEFL